MGLPARGVGPRRAGPRGIGQGARPIDDLDAAPDDWLATIANVR
jgi:hypothetical protein